MTQLADTTRSEVSLECFAYDCFKYCASGLASKSKDARTKCKHIFSFPHLWPSASGVMQRARTNGLDTSSIGQRDWRGHGTTPPRHTESVSVYCDTWQRVRRAPSATVGLFCHRHPRPQPSRVAFFSQLLHISSCLLLLLLCVFFGRLLTLDAARTHCRVMPSLDSGTFIGAP